MNRRSLLAVMAGAACGIGNGLALGQLASKVARVGRLSPLSAAAEAPIIEGFRLGMKALGWTEGRNLVIQSAVAGGRAELLRGLAEQLVASNVDVIVAGSHLGALAAKAATTTIPVVFVTTGDPVAGGLVTSLARPEANLTGITTLGSDLTAKRLQILKDCLPDLQRVVVMLNPTWPYAEDFTRIKDEVARSLRLEIEVIKVQSPAEIEAAFASPSMNRVGALMLLADLITHGEQIARLANERRLPTMAPDRALAASSLIYYGTSLSEIYRRQAAAYVDKILKGAKPSELPVEQPTTFELVVNLKIAKQLGLTIPPSVAIRADEVIE